jgi:hypothetical protein
MRGADFGSPAQERARQQAGTTLRAASTTKGSANGRQGRAKAATTAKSGGKIIESEQAATSWAHGRTIARTSKRVRGRLS